MQLGISNKTISKRKKESALIMRKQTKLVAVLSATALLAIGAAMTSFAASGWTDEGGQWAYYDKDGDMVTDEWKKSADGNWYYLDSDGYMLTDGWVDSTYYVDEDGKLVTNQWLKTYEDDGEEGPDADGDENWFYFGSAGSIVTDGWKKINDAWYLFDTDGAMKYGWHYDDDGKIFYLGDEDDGAMKSGWLKLVPGEEGDVSEQDAPNDESKWFNFKSNGQARKDDLVKINGSKYLFDEDGIMKSGWQTVVNDKVASDSDVIEEYKYFGESNDGSMATGWVELDENPLDDGDEDMHWYHFNSTGVPKSLNDGSTIMARMSKINSKYYLFDAEGRMQDGLVGLTVGSDSDAAVSVYLTKDGDMKTGKVTGVVEDDDEKYTYYFITSGSNKGAGYTGIKDGYIYVNGKLVTAEEDSDYQVFDVSEYSDAFGEPTYVVSEKGKVVTTSSTSGKNVKVDGEYKYTVTKDGNVYKYDTKVAATPDGNIVAPDYPTTIK